MRASKVAMLIAGLALWGGQAPGQPSQASEPSQASPLSQASTQPSPVSQPSGHSTRRMVFTTWVTPTHGRANRDWPYSTMSARHCWRRVTRISMQIWSTSAPPHRYRRNSATVSHASPKSQAPR